MFFFGYNYCFSDSFVFVLVDWFSNFNYSLLLGVLLFVSLVFSFVFFNNFFFKSFKIEYQFGELICSVLPCLILLVQMFPSLGLLYFYSMMSMDSSLTLKVVGHQWYWSYDYSDIEGLNFDSYMKSVDSLYLGDYRQLDVDNRCVLPMDLSVRLCISSSDVIHSWSLSNLSIKMDAMSGIISVGCYTFPTVGVFFGQCSEICGANHSFMPIVLEVCPFLSFKYWCSLFIS